MIQSPEAISQSKYEETDYSIPKIVLLALLSIASSVFAAYELNQFLSTFQYAFLMLSFVSLLAFAVINALNTLLIKHIVITWAIALMASFAPLALFTAHIHSDSIFALISALAFLFVCIVAASYSGMNVLSNSVKIKYFEVARVITPKVISGSLAVVCTIVYLTYVPWGGLTKPVARQIVGGALIACQPGIQFVYPTLNVNQTIETALREITITQIERLPPGAIPDVPFDLKAGLAQLSPQNREIVLSKFTEQLRQSIEAKLGTFQQAETVSDAVFRLLESYVKSLSSMTVMIGEVVLSVLLFLSLRGLFSFLYWFIDLVGFIIFKLLIAADIALLTYETRSREFVILP